MRIFISIVVIFFWNPLVSKGTNIFGLGIYDLKFDGSSTNQTADFRYEFRSDESLLDIGPKEDNFFYLKPFAGLEATTDSAFYLIGGIYLEDNLGKLLVGDKNEWHFTPSFGLGYYDDGNGKKLGNRTANGKLMFVYQAFAAFKKWNEI